MGSQTHISLSSSSILKIAENFHDPRTTKQDSLEDPAASALMDLAGAPMDWDSVASVACLGQTARR
jgi:hypothetical protein